MRPSERLAQVGHEWDLDLHVEVLRERRRASKDVQRYIIAVSVLCGIAFGLVALGWHGSRINDFGSVGAFWNAAGPVFGTILGYYFGKNGDDP